MRVDLLTKEYPPEVYGGAGVHVAELTQVLRPHLEVQVRAFGADREAPDTSSYRAVEVEASSEIVAHLLSEHAEEIRTFFPSTNSRQTSCTRT